jgi:hypothetical protein
MIEPKAAITFYIAAALLVLAFAISGCSSMRVRVGPVGSGTALTTAGPGIEFAFSNTEGAVVAGGHVEMQLPLVLNTFYGWLHGLLPDVMLSLFGTAETPTGPPTGAPKPPSTVLPGSDGDGAAADTPDADVVLSVEEMPGA